MSHMPAKIIPFPLTHTWLRPIRLSYLPGPTTPLLAEFAAGLLDCFQEHGHTVLEVPQGEVDVLLTTAVFGQPVHWREAVLFTAKRRFGLPFTPIVFTLLHVRPGDLQRVLDHFHRVLQKKTPQPEDYAFPGLAPMAYRTLHEQGRRGGPIMALARVIQAQSLSARAILLVGERSIEAAYTFDLVGAHPRSEGDVKSISADLVMRITTAASTHEVTQHRVVGEPIPMDIWRHLAAPQAMLNASRELGARDFFTEMVRVANLVNVPLLDAAISSQYSEGCFATWEPGIGALIATVTGSARPVEKDRLTEDELAVIVGVRPDGMGALVREVEGKHNDPPSSEAVEMMGMDAPLPRISLDGRWKGAVVPVARSKLHGHRGVRSYDPHSIEHAPLDPPYYRLPVSCATEAQANAIRTAFSRAEALRNPADPRQIVFTVLPGHGAVIVEKWIPEKAPFQIIWEAIDQGLIEIDNLVPQGHFDYVPAGGRMRLREG